jgi:EAL domain-containing protein (putative c-di-GMP-specific phosphodiesterase class I)
LGIAGSGIDRDGLAALRELPIEFLKIDGRCVRELLTSRGAERPMLAAIDAAQQAQHPQLAPCVDSPAQADRLRALGVGFACGAALGSPAPLVHLLRADS